MAKQAVKGGAKVLKRRKVYWVRGTTRVSAPKTRRMGRRGIS